MHVRFLIFQVSLIIIVCFLCQSKTQNQSQRSDIREEETYHESLDSESDGYLTNFECGNELCESSKEVEEIEEELELVEQDQWKKCDDVIFLVLHQVRNIVLGMYSSNKRDGSFRVCWSVVEPLAQCFLPPSPLLRIRKLVKEREYNGED